MTEASRCPYPSPVYFAYSVYIGANHHFPLHSHPYHELVLMHRGQLRAHVADTEYILNPGDLIIYPASTKHEEWTENAKPVLSWACGFFGKGFEKRIVSCRDTRGRILELIASLAAECHTYFKDLSEGENVPEMLQMLLAEITKLEANEPSAMIDQVRAYMRKNLANPFTLEDLATVASLCPSHFVRQYRVLTGRTPMEDARHLRVEEARRLIITTPLPLSAIAPMVGIASEFHLSRLLKTVLGAGVRNLRPQDRSPK